MSMIAFYNGAAGMRAFQSKLDVVGHNMANVQTFGYKPSRAAFDELIYTRINTNVAGEHLVGHGVKQQYVDKLMNQAGMDQTMQPLDFALVGNGFFQVQHGTDTLYTRNGAFDLSVENGTPYLVTSDGGYVLDRAGQRIALEEDDNGGFITDGLAQRLGVYRFDNQWGLEPVGNTYFAESANSGTAQLADMTALPEGNPLEVMQGCVEFSGVDMASEMVEVIMAQRAFQMSSRVLQTADEMANLLNNLR